jgi:hypothetical protein
MKCVLSYTNCYHRNNEFDMMNCCRFVSDCRCNFAATPLLLAACGHSVSHSGCIGMHVPRFLLMSADVLSLCSLSQCEHDAPHDAVHAARNGRSSPLLLLLLLLLLLCSHCR